MDFGWTIERIGYYRHILPVGEVHSEEDCPCNPEADEDLVIHNSFDHREEYEKGRKTN